MQLTLLYKLRLCNTPFSARRSRYTLPACASSRLTYLLTYSMVQSPSWEANWFAVSQEIPAFHGTRRFITALISVRHLSLSWASPIQSIHPHPTSWRSILKLSTHLRLGLPIDFLPSGFPSKILYTSLLLIFIFGYIRPFCIGVSEWVSVCVCVCVCCASSFRRSAPGSDHYSPPVSTIPSLERL